MAMAVAVAMEPTAWRGGDGSHPGKTQTQSPAAAWGADAQKLMQMMMGKLHTPPETAGGEAPQLSTLDLFGQASDPSFSQLASASASAPEFLELELEEPLPSGWEKCLDLKSGKLYYVEKSSGASTLHDPRKQLSAHEFLGSKSSETLSLKASSSSSSDTPGPSLRWLPPSTPREYWNYVDAAALATSGFLEPSRDDDDSNVELDLNLAAGGSGGGSSSPSPSSRRQTVCTMEMIKDALRRSKNPSSRGGQPKRTASGFQSKLSTVSSSLSSVTTRSDPAVAPSPSTSSSSSTSSRSCHAPTTTMSSSGVSGEDGDAALVMGACTRCLMFVMLKKRDPKCPRCESAVPLDFSEPPCKRQRGGSERGGSGNQKLG